MFTEPDDEEVVGNKQEGKAEQKTDKRVARALMGIILLLGGAPLATVKKLTGMYEEVE